MYKRRAAATKKSSPKKSASSPKKSASGEEAAALLLRKAGFSLSSTASLTPEVTKEVRASVKAALREVLSASAILQPATVTADKLQTLARLSAKMHPEEKKRSGSSTGMRTSGMRTSGMRTSGMRGGSPVLPSEYFGIDSGSYHAREAVFPHENQPFSGDSGLARQPIHANDPPFPVPVLTGGGNGSGLIKDMVQSSGAKVAPGAMPRLVAAVERTFASALQDAKASTTKPTAAMLRKARANMPPRF